MRPLKISFFTQTTAPHGTYFRAHMLALSLIRLGHSVTIFSCDHNPRSKTRVEVRDGVPYTILNGCGGQSYFGQTSHPITAMRRCFINYDYCDIAHLFQPLSNAAAPWFIAMGSKANARFYDWDDLWIDGILSIKHGLSDTFVFKQIHFLESFLPGTADHVTGISRYLCKLGFMRGAKRVTYIPNGIHDLYNLDKQSARYSLGLKADCLYLGFMGHTGVEVKWCIEDYLAIAKLNTNIRLALCGNFEMHINALNNEQLSKIDYLGLVSYEKSQLFAQALDLALLPLDDSRFNRSRLPFKFTDYLSSGTPVLASEIGETWIIGKDMPWVLSGGRTRHEWRKSLSLAIQRLRDHSMPTVDIPQIKHSLSWDSVSTRLADAYSTHLENP